MSKRVLVITDKDSTVTKMMIPAFLNRKCALIPAEAVLSSLPEKKDCPPVVFLCLDKYGSERRTFLYAVRDLVRDAGAKLFIGGSRAEMEKGALRVFDKEMISGFYYRPFPVAQMVETMIDAIGEDEA